MCYVKIKQYLHHVVITTVPSLFFFSRTYMSQNVTISCTINQKHKNRNLQCFYVCRYVGLSTYGPIFIYVYVRVYVCSKYWFYILWTTKIIRTWRLLFISWTNWHQNNSNTYKTTQNSNIQQKQKKK